MIEFIDIEKQDRHPHWNVLFSVYWGLCLGPKEILNPDNEILPDPQCEPLAHYHDRVTGGLTLHSSMKGW